MEGIGYSDLGLALVAVGALNTVFVFANQAQKIPQDGSFVLRIPCDDKAHVEILRDEGRDNDPWRTDIADARGNQCDAFAGFDECENAGPGGRGTDDVRRKAGSRAQSDDAVEETGVIWRSQRTNLSATRASMETGFPARG
jgi:hypothetical protein